ncbi:class II histone deacetylase [Grimontia marina]|uniref:Histone deacetylase-like amidohydrolase n=1 Tax=Grimontia marina TaxID=646534 RepID=A0A128F7M9_9GAMM|nr:class II histone deacetylase [Grimontia marina]CZF82738.1 Histone deacetylase-like amidohydrolase [Grimontia marina]
MRKTGLVTHELYFWHNTGEAAAFLPPGLTIQPDKHAENAETKRRLLNLLNVAGLADSLTTIPPRLASNNDLLSFHTQAYIDSIREMSDANGGDAGELTPFGPGSYEIALMSLGGCLEAVDRMMEGQVDNAYCLVRPPGHHAESEMGRGFCIFGNGVITANYALDVHGMERIAIVDWDVHHGNSQQGAFYQNSGVLTISIHQDNFYPPMSGALEERGEGEGEGYNINVPLPPGSGDGAYRKAFEDVVLPALEAYQPDLIIVSSGFDGSAIDPLGRNMATSETYRYMTESLVDAAEKLCHGHLICIHEGGYSTAYVPYCGLAVMEALSGLKTELEDPFLPIVGGMGGQECQPHQAALIALVAESAPLLKK